MAFALAALPPQTTVLQLRYNPSALSCSEVISADATHPPHGELHHDHDGVATMVAGLCNGTPIMMHVHCGTRRAIIFYQ